MATEFNERLSFFHRDRTQIWIIGTREQVIHLLNEFCAKQIAPDYARLMPPVPIASAPGKFIALLEC